MCWDRLRSNRATGEENEQGGEWPNVKSEQKLCSKRGGDLGFGSEWGGEPSGPFQQRSDVL